MQIDWQWQSDIRSDEFIASIIQYTAEECTLWFFFMEKLMSASNDISYWKCTKKLKQG